MGLLLTMAGSALPRAVVPALLSAIWAIILELTGLPKHIQKHSSHSGSRLLSEEDEYDRHMESGDLASLFQHTYPYQVFAYMVGIALVFRTNVAYSRYWEGISAYKTFAAKWGDAACLVLSFDRHGTHEHNDHTRSLFAALCVHRFSLMQALASAHLRRENFLRPVAYAPLQPSSTILPGSSSGGGGTTGGVPQSSPRPVGGSAGVGGVGSIRANCSPSFRPGGAATIALTAVSETDGGGRMVGSSSDGSGGGGGGGGGSGGGGSGSGGGAWGDYRTLSDWKHALHHFLGLFCPSCFKSASAPALRARGSLYSAYLRSHPLPVLGGMSNAERAFLAKLDSETRVTQAHLTHVTHTSHTPHTRLTHATHTPHTPGLSTLSLSPKRHGAPSLSHTDGCTTLSMLHVHVLSVDGATGHCRLCADFGHGERPGERWGRRGACAGSVSSASGTFQ